MGGIFHSGTAKYSASLHHDQWRGLNLFIYLEAQFSSVLANRLNGSKGAAPAVIYRLLMISNAIAQSKKVTVAGLHFPVMIPPAEPSGSRSLATTHLPSLWRLLSLLSEHVPCCSKWKVCKHSSLICALW